MNTRKGLAVLGSTGSVGVNTLDVVASHADKFDVITLAAHSNLDLIEQQARRFRPRLAKYDEEGRLPSATFARSDIDVDGNEGYAAATYTMELDTAVAIGLLPTIRAVETGIDGPGKQRDPGHGRELVIRPDKPAWGRVIPVDSEHTPLRLHGHHRTAVRRLLRRPQGDCFANGR
jgi:1-deoxy-D-xylulose-5-phosphate reductoisomerase